jgi:hypothetical protein
MKNIKIPYLKLYLDILFVALYNQLLMFHLALKNFKQWIKLLKSKFIMLIICLKI